MNTRSFNGVWLRLDEAYERILRADVRYRFVIDIASLAAG